MNDPIIVRYRLDAEMLIEANRMHLRRSWRDAGSFKKTLLISLFTISGISILSIAFVIDMMPRPQATLFMEKNVYPVAMGLFGFALVLIYGDVCRENFLKGAVQRHFQSVSTGTTFVVCSFSEDLIDSRTELTTSLMRWEIIWRIVECPAGFLLYSSKQIYSWLPSHGFASPIDIERFIEVAKRRTPNYLTLGPCRYAGKPEPIFDDF